MAKPTDSYPEAATNGARERRPSERSEPSADEGTAALREALDVHGEDLAAAVELTDELDDALQTAILVAATADDDDVEHITSSTANLVAAVDGLSTDDAAELATDVGHNAEELGDALDVVLDFQREGHLDDFLTLATAFSESLSPEEVEELSAMLEANGTELVEALDMVLDLQRTGKLEDLVELAETLSVLEIDDDTVAGLNGFLSAVGEAQRESEPVGLIGTVKQLFDRDARAGLGYLVAILRAQGRRLRND